MLRPIGVGMSLWISCSRSSFLDKMWGCTLFNWPTILCTHVGISTRCLTPPIAKIGWKKEVINMVKLGLDKSYFFLYE